MALRVVQVNKGNSMYWVYAGSTRIGLIFKKVWTTKNRGNKHSTWHLSASTVRKLELPATLTYEPYRTLRDAALELYAEYENRFARIA
jgi:hypothetical protein